MNVNLFQDYPFGRKLFSGRGRLVLLIAFLLPSALFLLTYETLSLTHPFQRIEKDAPHNSFLTFYLPPQSTVGMENYRFLMREETLTQAFEAWEVEHLRAGEKTPFDQWISLDLMSSGNGYLTKKL